ncbi:polymer-forming cytoskeletal protein [Hydrogenophaga sp.]|uniref:bactofilin family protein n=1 Tax=Hydrogenophaga sp. TaxID=1904254 RepID=UPI0025BD3DED|nr:polymer-forming cytoskeletal protein [Hydrogenophaga sp.]
MKSTRYQQPDRHLDEAMDQQDNNDITNPSDANDGMNNQTDSNTGGGLSVDVGTAMPTSLAAQMPVLGSPQLNVDGESGQPRSLLADGMHFVGNAILRGPFSVAGQVDGNLQQANDTLTSVVVTETGRVKGDITAHKISVMGHTEGILDSGQGEVSLHDTADVHGLVRYGRIQVNGASLNATLERVAPSQKSNV